MYRYNMKKDVRKYLGLKVRAMREAANMTQEELATICDVSWRTISNLERGTVVPDLFMIYRIAQNFDVKIDELLDHQIINQKSLSRIEKENKIIEKIKRIDDNILDSCIGAGADILFRDGIDTTIIGCVGLAVNGQ